MNESTDFDGVMRRYGDASSVVPAAVREDPLVQYLLGFALVALLVGSVGAVAQYLHWGEIPSLAYVATVVGIAAAFVTLAVAYDALVLGR